MSLFGEISEPSSRTVWEDWDENSDLSDVIETRRLELKSPFVDLKSISTFYIFEGKYLSECVNIQNQYELLLLNTIPEVGLQLYIERKSDTVVCTIKDYDVILSSEIVDLLRNYILLSKELIAVQVKPVSEYQTNTALSQNCIIRQIFTGKTRFNTILKLEQPNIISGVSAGALSLRYHLNLNGSALVFYVELGEDYEIHAVQNLLQSLNILQTPIRKPNNVLNSNLYI